MSGVDAGSFDLWNRLPRKLRLFPPPTAEQSHRANSSNSVGKLKLIIMSSHHITRSLRGLLVHDGWLEISTLTTLALSLRGMSHLQQMLHLSFRPSLIWIW